MTDSTETTGGGWRPEPGDTINGKIVDIATGDGGYGPYPIVTLATDDGQTPVHAFHQVLRTELARRRPKIGDEVTITYVGKQPPKNPNGSPYHVYRVNGGSGVGYDWSRDVPDEDVVGAPVEPQSDIPSDTPAPADPDLQAVAASGGADDDLPF